MLVLQRGNSPFKTNKRQAQATSERAEGII